MAHAKNGLIVAAVLLLMGFAVYMLTSVDAHVPDPANMGAPETLQDDSTQKQDGRKRIYKAAGQTPDKRTTKPEPEPVKKLETSPSDKTVDKKIIPTPMRLRDVDTPRQTGEAPLNKEYVKKHINNKTRRVITYIGPQCDLTKDDMRDITNLLLERNRRIFDLEKFDYDFDYDFDEFKRERDAIIKDYNIDLRNMLSEEMYKKFDKLFFPRDPAKRFLSKSSPRR